MLFDLVDDVIQHDYMFHRQGTMRLARIQLRELAHDLLPGGFILYASQSAVVCKSLMLVKVSFLFSTRGHPLALCL